MIPIWTSTGYFTGVYMRYFKVTFWSNTLSHSDIYRIITILPDVDLGILYSPQESPLSLLSVLSTLSTLPPLSLFLPPSPSANKQNFSNPVHH
jgi:ABC-type proline/glycine betaine transport system permease subunit